MKLKADGRLLFQIFWTFFRISPVTFGGGFAMIPLIIKEIVEKKKWLTTDEITDVIALSQTVPGAVAVNSATFIGHRIGGIRGALAAMFGVSLPTFLIVLAFGISYFHIHDNPKLEAAFISIRVTIVAIIVYAAIKIAKTAITDKTTFFIMASGVPLLFFIHPILVIFLGAITGIIAIYIKKKLGYDTEMKKSKEDDPTNNPDYYMGAGI
jgi:chromate transporter